MAKVVQGVTKSVYSQNFSSVPYTKFSGGTYKASNIRSFPASTTMSGSLVNLYPGGLREPHWHNPNEWAYVINGTCRYELACTALPGVIYRWPCDP